MLLRLRLKQKAIGPDSGLLVGAVCVQSRDAGELHFAAGSVGVTGSRET
jgi:hypothetical protein